MRERTYEEVDRRMDEKSVYFLHREITRAAILINTLSRLSLSEGGRLKLVLQETIHMNYHIGWFHGRNYEMKEVNRYCEPLVN